jgi:hypothetical protein
MKLGEFVAYFPATESNINAMLVLVTDFISDEDAVVLRILHLLLQFHNTFPDGLFRYLTLANAQAVFDRVKGSLG